MPKEDRARLAAAPVAPVEEEEVAEKEAAEMEAAGAVEVVEDELEASEDVESDAVGTAAGSLSGLSLVVVAEPSEGRDLGGPFGGLNADGGGKMHRP